MPCRCYLVFSWHRQNVAEGQNPISKCASRKRGLLLDRALAPGASRNGPSRVNGDSLGILRPMSEQTHSYSTLTLAYEGTLALITLNRPEKRNAISYELIDDVLRVLAEVEKSPAQILILTGSGKAFCSGMDLDNLRSITGRTADENRADSATMARLFRTLYEFPKVTIAAVNGPAIAGGCGLATLCDFTLASTEAKFGYTEVRIGFVPAIVSTFLLRQIGESRPAIFCSPDASSTPTRRSVSAWPVKLSLPTSLMHARVNWQRASCRTARHPCSRRSVC